MSSCAFEETIPPVGTGTGISLSCETLDCNDNIPCTIDSCENDACVHLPNHSVCDDGLFCNGVEQCTAFRGCIAGSEVVTSDDISCTLDTCDEKNDMVVNTPQDSACGEPGFCFASVRCDPVLDCVSGAPNPDIDDGIGCTIDSCNENADPKITHIPMDEMCPDDGLFCSGRAFCSMTNGAPGCQIAPGPIPILPDGVTCTVDACDEDNDTFTYTADDSLCNDGLSCSADTCDEVNDCQFAGPDGCLCNTPIFDNGDTDPSFSGPIVPSSKNFETDGIVEDFVLEADDAFCSVEFSVAFRSLLPEPNPAPNPEAMEVAIYKVADGGTVADLGDFTAAIAMYEDTFSVADESLFVEDTGTTLESTGATLYRYKAGNASISLPAGSYAVWVRFPDIATMAVVSLANVPVKSADGRTCANTWGDETLNPEPLCGGANPDDVEVDFKVNTSD